MRDRKRVDLDETGGGEELGREGRETVIRVCYMKKNQ